MIPLWLSILSFAFGGVCALGGAAAVIWSKYRQQTDAEREKLIVALTERNKFLEADKARSAQEREEDRRMLHQLEGKVRMLQELVLRQCPRAEIDPESGGCTHCAFGMAYGQGGAL